MKFKLNHRWLLPDSHLSALVQRKFSKLAELVRIDAAEVTLEKHPENSPPFSAKVHLAVPGPDIHAEEKGHTPQATIQKVVAKLARQIRHRNQKLLTKRRSGAKEMKPWNRSHQPLSMQTA